MSSHDVDKEQVYAVQARYSDSLMRKPHVVGVAVGLRSDGSGRFCLVVMVEQPLPRDAPDHERIPDEIENVPVEVRVMGAFIAH